MSASKVRVIALLVLLAFVPVLHALQTCVVFLDNFASVAYNNNNGSANFAGAWTEIGESNGAASGDVVVVNTGTAQGLRIHNANKGAQRTVNLAAYGTASLNLAYRRVGLNGTGKYVQVLISSDNGTNFTEVGRFAGSATDSTNQIFSVNITPYISSTTIIRFLSSNALSSTEDVYIDSVSIAACSRQLTTCAASFPDAASSHSATGAVSFASSGGVLNSPDRILEAPSVTIGAPNTSTCGTNIQCVASASTVATINPGTFKTTTAIIDQTVAASATATLGPATSQWDRVTLGASSTLTVDTSSSTEFRIDELVLGASSTLNLSAGDYWIRNLQIQNGARINATSGTVRIYVNDAATLTATSFVNSPATNSSGTVSRLVWYSYGDLTISNGSTMSGMVYSRGNITLVSTSYIFGAATAANVVLQTSSVISYNTTAIDATNFGGMCSNLYPAVGWYAFDEASWNGTAGEVSDGGSNNLDGRARTSASGGTVPTTAASGAGCRYGVFNGPSSQQYVEVTDNSLLDITNELTVGVWVYARSLPASELMSILSKDWNVEFHLTPSGTINWWWNDSSSTTRTFNSSTTLTINAWHHVAITYKSGTQTIYIDGVAAGSATYTGTLRASATPLQFGQDQGIANRFFNGYLDEVRLYNMALTQAQVQEMMGLNHSCSTVTPTVIDHFSVVPTPTQAVTCDAITVDVEPHTSADGVPTSYTGLVTLTATVTPASGPAVVAGTWELVTGTALNFTSTGTGTATYRYSSGESTARFRYKNTTAGTVSFTAVDGAISASENSTVAFSTAGFIFLVNGSSVSSTPIPTQISGKDSNSGWNSRTLAVRAVTTDPTTGVCVSRLPASTTQTFEFAYDCTNPASCSASPTFNITGNATATAIPANTSTPTTWASVSVALDSTAAAPLVANYNDAGQVQLYVRKVLADSSSGPAVTLSGNASVTYRPFGIRFESITGNQGGDETGLTNSDKFVAAGSSFSMPLTAFGFVAGQDANNDGTPDSTANVSSNLKTSNFSAPVDLSLLSHTPSTGAAGTLGVLASTFTAGVVSETNQTYSEVGSITTNAVVSNYLSLPSADIAALTANSTKIGRFYPYDFLLSDVTLTPPCAAFTYMSQPITTSYALTARNAFGVATTNYSAALGYQVPASVAFVAENNNDGGGGVWVNRVMETTAGTWSSGLYSLNPVSPLTYSGSISFNRLSTLDGPYASVQLGMQVVDKDGSKLSVLDMQHDGTGTCTSTTCSAKSIGSTAVYRYGRLAMRDTTGSELAQAITIPVYAEYYNGSEFTRNYDDSCTVYGVSAINDVDFSVYQGNLTATNFVDGRTPAGNWSLPSADTTMQSGALRSYPSGLHVLPSGNTGSVVLTLKAPDWLKYDWNTPGVQVDPFATLTLGQNRGHDRIIYWREIH